LPDLRYIWLRRRDFVRQGVSWWRAAHTNQYAVTDQDAVAAIPAYDFEEVGRLVAYAEACDDGWGRWFARHAIEPLVFFYEDIVEDLAAAVVDVLRFLAVECSAELPPIRPRMHRQADDASERIVRRFLADAAAAPRQ
jgi:LPS sulfotransferase NodH